MLVIRVNLNLSEIDKKVILFIYLYTFSYAVDLLSDKSLL